MYVNTLKVVTLFQIHGKGRQFLLKKYWGPNSPYSMLIITNSKSWSYTKRIQYLSVQSSLTNAFPPAESTILLRFTSVKSLWMQGNLFPSRYAQDYSLPLPWPQKLLSSVCSSWQKNLKGWTTTPCSVLRVDPLQYLPHLWKLEPKGGYQMTLFSPLWLMHSFWAGRRFQPAY